MLWKFILKTYKRNLSEQTLADLAAGPLEDLIADFGAQYIEQIEDLARKDARFNHLLGGVWQRGGPKDIWARVVHVRKGAVKLPLRFGFPHAGQSCT